MQNLEKPEKIKKVKKIGFNAKKLGIAALAVVVLSSGLLFCKYLSKKDAVIQTENEVTIFGMYVDPSHTYEVRENFLIEITKDGEEFVIMELTDSQVKKLEKQNSRGFVLDLEK